MNSVRSTVYASQRPMITHSFARESSGTTGKVTYTITCLSWRAYRYPSPTSTTSTTAAFTTTSMPREEDLLIHPYRCLVDMKRVYGVVVASFALFMWSL